MFPTARSDRIRSRVTLDEIDGLQITIPAARSPFLVLFLSVWLLGWSVGEVTALRTLAAWAFGAASGQKFGNAGGPPAPFLIFWLAFWTVAGVVMLDALVWQFRGRETIGVDPDGRTLVIRRLGTFVPRRTRTFSIEDVRNLRVSPLGMSMFPSPFAFRENWDAQLQWLGNGGGSIAFDHPGGTQRFGTQLSDTEARRLIKTIREHYKIQDDKDEPLPVERL
jgi:hypothetical protein